MLGLYSFLIGYVAVELPRSEIRFHVLANVILAFHLMGMVRRLRYFLLGVGVFAVVSILIPRT